MIYQISLYREWNTCGTETSRSNTNTYVRKFRMHKNHSKGLWSYKGCMLNMWPPQGSWVKWLGLSTWSSVLGTWFPVANWPDKGDCSTQVRGDSHPSHRLFCQLEMVQFTCIFETCESTLTGFWKMHQVSNSIRSARNCTNGFAIWWLRSQII